MQINLSSLKIWLREKLTALSIADPTPLSQYIIVLVGKDKPEEELKLFCIEQLEELLRENTESFVYEMFSAIHFQNNQNSSSCYNDKLDESNRHQLKGNIIGSSHRKRYRSRSSSPHSNENKIRQRSPMRKSRSPLDSEDINNSRGRRPTYNDSKRNQENRQNYKNTHEYNPEDFNGRSAVTRISIHGEKTSSNTHRSRASSDHSDDSRSERSTQRLERVERVRGERNSTARNVLISKNTTSLREKILPLSSIITTTNTTNSVDNSILSAPTIPPKRRCRNFDEKGFCFYGDRCKYEHGTDALVLPGTSAAFFSNAAAAAASLMDTALVSGTCLIPKPKQDDDLVVGGSKKSNLAELTSKHLQPSMLEGEALIPVYTPTPIVDSLSARMPIDGVIRPTPFNQPQSSTIFSQSQRDCRYRNQQGICNGPINKNIIPVPLAPNLNEVLPPPAYEPARPNMDLDPFVGEEPSTPQPSEILAEYTPSPIIQDANPQLSSLQQSSILVTRLPWRLNNHSRLHEHFGHFGTVVNVETNFEGQNSQALVTFSSPLEAEAAYRSPEPILSNRFIRLQLCPPGNNSNGFQNRRNGGPFGGRFRGGNGRRDSLGFSHQNQSLLGDAATVGLRLPAKLRLGEGLNNNLNNITPLASGRLKRPNNSTASFINKPNRSRWRLERDEDGNHLEEDAAEDEELGVYENLSTIDNLVGRRRLPSNGSEDNEDNEVSLWNLTNEERRQTALQKSQKDALWERKKATALKEYHNKIALRKQQETMRRQEEVDRVARIAQLKEDWKSTIGEFDILASLADKNLAAQTKHTLLLKAKAICRELDELKKTSKPTERKQRTTSNSFSGTSEEKPITSVTQLLPDNLAAERQEQIAEVKQKIQKLDSQLQKLHGDEEEQTILQVELRRKITKLKRKLVNLETVRASDLAGINANSGSIPLRGQTKLDKRPRILYVSGHSVYDVEDFRQALSMNYLYTEGFLPFAVNEQPVIEVTFRTRDFAEAAVRLFANFRGRNLTMSFTPPASDATQLATCSSSASGKLPSATDVTAIITTSDVSRHKEVLDENAANSDEEVESCKNNLIELSAPVVDATVGEEFRSPENCFTSIKSAAL